MIYRCNERLSPQPNSHGFDRDINASIYATPENTKKFEALLTDDELFPVEWARRYLFMTRTC